MAKRLTDTEKWKDEWYLSLSNDYKVIWQYLLDSCNHAGLMKRGVSLLNFSCKTEITEEELLRVFDKRIFALTDYYFIPKFIKFQYGNLVSDKPVIVSVIRGLEQSNDYRIIKQLLANHSIMIKDKDKSIDKDKSKSLLMACENINIPFDIFWNAYDKKKGDKEKLTKKWHLLTDSDRTAIMGHIPKYKESQPDKQYRKDPQTFLNNKSWNDELIYKNGKPAERKTITLN